MKRIGLVLGVLFIILAVGCGGRVTSPPLAEEVTELLHAEEAIFFAYLAERVEATVNQCEVTASKYDVHYSGLVDERPDYDFGFNNQVLSLEELKVGETYVSCYLGSGGGAWVYTVISKPYEMEISEDHRVLAVDVLWWMGDGWVLRDEIFLTSHGIIPNSSGLWNPMKVLLHLLPVGVWR